MDCPFQEAVVCNEDCALFVINSGLNGNCAIRVIASELHCIAWNLDNENKKIEGGAYGRNKGN